MDNMQICGSCHTLVQGISGVLGCPRCGDPLDPSAESILEKFIDTGIVEFNRKGGVTLHEAQGAAREVLSELLRKREEETIAHHEAVAKSDEEYYELGGEG